MKFAKEVLDEHNKYRRMHGVPPLTLSTSVKFHKSIKLIKKLNGVFAKK